MRPFQAFETFVQPRAFRPRVSPEGRVALPGPQTLPETGGIQPLPFLTPATGGIRQWHMTPWRQKTFLDMALSDSSTDASGGTSWTDVINNLVTEAGNVFTARSLPPGYTAPVPRPMPGQVSGVVPTGVSTILPGAPGTVLGLTPTQLLVAGAAVLGGIMLLKKGRR